MIGEVIGGIQCPHEWKWPLDWIPLGFVIDVVKDQAVQAERKKPSDRCVGDLLHAFAIRREARRVRAKSRNSPWRSSIRRIKSRAETVLKPRVRP
jgi:hypothetical protein